MIVSLLSVLMGNNLLPNWLEKGSNTDIEKLCNAFSRMHLLRPLLVDLIEGTSQCAFNAFLAIVVIILNGMTIQALRSTSSLPKPQAQKQCF